MSQKYGELVLGEPTKTEHSTRTILPETELEDYLFNLGESQFSAEHFNRNCNTFSQNMSQFLCGINIPEPLFNVAIAGDRVDFPDLSSLNISNIESAMNISMSQLTETGTVYPVMNISYQNTQTVKKETTAYDAYVNDGNSCTTTDDLVNSIDNILQNNNQPIEVRVNLLQTLANIALNGEIIQILRNYKGRNLIRYIESIAHKSYEEQKAIALFVCNLLRFINDMESRLWLFCHIREVISVAKHCLLQPCDILKDFGTLILYNLALKVGNELISEIVIDLTSTLITFLTKKPIEEHLFRSLTAISIFVTVSDETVMLMKIFGQDYLNFRGTSNRCDQLIDKITQNII